MVLSRSEARQIIETWLAEAHLSRETCRFALPPSQQNIAAGSLLSFADAPDVSYRVDRVERGEYLMIDATRHDPNVRQVSPPISTGTHVTPYVPLLSVDVTFLDLPMLKSDQIAHAPYVMATGDPWPGPIAVYGADEGGDFEHLTILNTRATKVVLKSRLPAGVNSRIEHGQSLDVVMSSGQLHSVSMLQMLNGANTAAIGNASLNQWEIVQFQSVELLSKNTYRLANLVRGKFGSHAEDHEGWAEGADFVLLHAGVDQLPMSEENRTAQRTYRVGPITTPHIVKSYGILAHVVCAHFRPVICDGRKLQKYGRLRGPGAGAFMLIHGRASTFRLGKRASFTDCAYCVTGRMSWNSQRQPRRPSYPTRTSQRLIRTYSTSTFQSRFPKYRTPMVRVLPPLWRWDEGDPYRRCAYVGPFCCTE
jgi:hypothetical protein